MLAVGADLKNTITLAIDGEAFVSQHIGDLDHYAGSQAFQRDHRRSHARCMTFERGSLMVAHDSHPQYVSTQYGLELPAAAQLPVQHHRAHIASVLAEARRGTQPVIGVASTAPAMATMAASGAARFSREACAGISAGRASESSGARRRRCGGAASGAGRGRVPGADWMDLPI